MIPNATKRKYFQNSIDYETDTIRALLLKVTTSYTPDPDTHEFVDDVLAVADEYDDTNYTRIDLTGLTVRQDDTNDRAEWDADDLVWNDLGSNIGQVIQTVVVYRQVGGDDTTPADDDVLRVMDSSEESELPISTNGSNVVIEFDVEGIKYIG